MRYRDVLQRPTLRLLILARRLFRNDQAVLAALALIVGIAAAGGAIAFREGIALAQSVAFGFGHEQVITGIADLSAWRVVLAPVVGGLVVGLLVRYAMPGREAQGVAHVMESAALRGGRMPLRTGLLTAVISATSLGVGASTGREGPAVHLGATLGSAIARPLRLSRALSRTLLGCGVAAAVAASFNAPIAGVFFALEVVVGHYALSAFAPIVLASVVGTVVSRQVYGDFPAFVLPEVLGPISIWEFPAFALLGLVSAGVAFVFMWSVMTAGRVVRRVSLPLVLRPALAGLLIGITALWLPHVLGVGYEATDMALKEQLALWLMITLIGAKIAATALCLGCGFGGGVFSPSLFIGAMTGGAFGTIAAAAFPALASALGAYTLVGMGAVAGAVLGAPISTILIIFEMTGDYTLTIAVMVAVVVSVTLLEQTLGRSLFVWQLALRGVNLRQGREVGLLSRILVSDVMKRDYVTVPPEADLTTVIGTLRTATYGEVFVVDGNGRLSGTLTLADIAHLPDQQTDAPLTAGEAARTDPPVLEASEDVRAAMRLMDSAAESHIPVVETRLERRVVGFVHEHDVLHAYHRALLEARAEETGGEAAAGKPLRQRSPRDGNPG